MTISLKMILEMEARSAKAELAATSTALKGLGNEAQTTAGKTRQSKVALEDLTAAAQRGTTVDKAAAAAKHQASAAADELARANRVAAGSMGNLAAQGNDVVMMMMAGQNPFQLAIQQGTQIGQVLGPMGAAGAFKALGGAVLQMISPVNLVTFAVIGGTAALVNWAMGAKEGEDAAVSLEDQLQNLISSIGDYQQFAVTAAASTTELSAKFGSFANEVRGFAEYMQQVTLGQSLDEMAAKIDPLKGGLTEVQNMMELVAQRSADIARMDPMDAEGIFRAQQALDLFKDQANEAASELGLTADQAVQLGAAIDQLGTAKGMVGMRDAAAAALSLLAQMVPVGSELPAPLQAAAAALNEIVSKTSEATAISASLGEVVSQLYADLLAAASANLSSVFASAIPAANSLLGVTNTLMTRLGAVAAAYAKYGPSGVIPLTDTPKGKFSYGGMDAVARGEMAKQPSPFGRIGTGAAGVSISTGKGGGGGGAAAAKAEANALQDLIDKLHGEIDALKTQDPIQKEMLKYREALAGATDAERKQVEALIVAREKEALAVQGMQDAKNFFEQTGVDALDALITKGESLQDVLKGVAAAFLKAAIQGALFGQGPFGKLFGGTSILGGIFGGGKGGGLLSSLFGGKADGGMIYGRGTGKSDSELRALSVGEFVVNAKATARNRHTLEAINAGSSIPGLAGGGMVDSGRRRGSGSYGRDAAPTMVAHFSLDGARGDREIEAAAERGMKKALNQYDRTILPTSIKRVSGDPRRTG